MRHFMAVDNVCAWPNLTPLPDGDIVAIIFDQPCHGQWEGDVACWASSDGGCQWEHRGQVTVHEPATNRMNVAAGLAADGTLVVLVSGWSNRNPIGQPSSPHEGQVLTPWICRSRDQGATWRCEGDLQLGGRGSPIPFGDILPATDGSLQATLYAVSNRYPRTGVSLIESADHGLSWHEKTTIVDDGQHNETTIVHVADDRWLAASRTAGRTNLDLLISEDHGATWRLDQPLTGPMMAPAHLLRLRDGRLLLTYGIRHRGCYGVGGRLSDDGGATWSHQPFVLVDFGPATDGGYPSSVERDDGVIVTAWYANATTMHHRYQMGVTHWRLDEV